VLIIDLLSVGLRPLCRAYAAGDSACGSKVFSVLCYSDFRAERENLSSFIACYSLSAQSAESE
jgi:hypothetical protein